MENLSYKNRHKFQVFTDENGNQIHLKDKLGRGCEGAVYTIEENPNLLAKIYLNRHEKTEKIKKIQALRKIYTDELAQVATLPKSLLYDSCNLIAGYTMEKIEGYTELCKLGDLDYAQRYLHCADYSAYVRLAINIAHLFDKLYSANIVIGDINTKNILVNKDCEVKGIDTDSYQFELDGEVYLCRQCVLRALAPEYKDIDTLAIKRDLNGSLFGLAILIFLILTYGKNPYITPGMPYTMREFFEYHYYYKSDEVIADDKLNIFFNIFTDEIRELFDRAFIVSDNVMRPTAKEWITVLEDFKKSLIVCDIHKSHVYSRYKDKCTWCEINQYLKYHLY